MQFKNAFVSKQFWHINFILAPLNRDDGWWRVMTGVPPTSVMIAAVYSNNYLRVINIYTYCYIV